MSKRWWRLCDSQRRIYCKSGHHIPHTFHARELGCVRCNHWLGAEKRECGNWSYLIVIPGRGIVVCEVSLQDLEAMEKLATPLELVSYLGFFDKPETGAA